MKPCLRCLIADLPDEAALADILRERIAQLDEAERLPENQRAQRLDICRSCGSLNHGTCALCGCYVELRAARRSKGCPCVPPRWPAPAKDGA